MNDLIFLLIYLSILITIIEVFTHFGPHMKDNKVNTLNIDCKDLLNNFSHIKDLLVGNQQVILEARKSMKDQCKDSFKENVTF